MMGPGKLSRLIADPGSPALLRGEIWVSPDVLAQAGFARGPQGLVALASSLGADICFFPWPGPAAVPDLKELAELAHFAGLDCGLTIDGPFQRLASAGNVLDVFLELGRDPAGFRRRLNREMEGITKFLGLIEEAGIGLVVIGEDVGYAGGLYFSPEVFHSHLLPFYRVLVGRLSPEGIAVGWHSDGKVAPILPDLLQCGFRFFALEPECVDLLRFKRAHGPRATLIGGVRTEWLTTEEPGPEQQARWREEIRELAGEGGLIVASCCGIHSPLFLSRLRRLYRLFDGI
ncbi:MAG: hypothetical protein KJ936_01095 [Proteobacteria bacterium]|nr:hypothetical protein [Pseudomonadota bacterium]MBU2226264.1 hypothetical protein [Pseudomonadota bacterium]